MKELMELREQVTYSEYLELETKFHLLSAIERILREL